MVSNCIKQYQIAFFVLFIFCSDISFGQYQSFKLNAKGDTINAINSAGQKIGKWVIEVGPLRGEEGYVEEGLYKKGEKHGYWRKYSTIGDLLAVEHYILGGKDGLQQYYNYLGALEREENWRGYNQDAPYDTVAIYGTGSNEIIDYKNNCDDTTVSFKIVMQKLVIDQLIESGEMIKKLKLTSSISTSNMHIFDSDCKIRKVSCPEEIIYRFYKVRKEHFIKRKKYLLESMESEYTLMESKIRFIKLVVEEKIVVFNKKKDFIVNQIISHNLTKVKDSYDYLLDLKISMFTLEKIQDLSKKVETIKSELEKLKNTTIETLWNTELLSLDF
jgi:hypothetical protein